MSALQTALPDRLREYLDRSAAPLSVAEVGGDMPLVYINEPFRRLTGYGDEDCLGRNCRFLQGPDTDPDDRQALRDFVADPEAENGRFPILNYRKDGSAFRNYVLMTRLRDREGSTRFILGSQFDITTAAREHTVQSKEHALRETMIDVEALSREFGLAVLASAQMISDSVALLARLALDEAPR
ncbi:PAS domain-containing protein [Roseivivax sp. CAU 1761]